MEERRFVNNEEKSRYELHVGKYVALAEYIINIENTVYMTDTEVPKDLEGQGVASDIIKRSLEDIKAKGFKVYPLCPFVIAYIRKHPEWRELVR